MAVSESSFRGQVWDTIFSCEGKQDNPPCVGETGEKDRNQRRAGVRHIQTMTPPPRRDQTLWTHKYSPIEWEVGLSRNVSKLTFPPICASILFDWPKYNISLSFYPLISIIFLNLFITYFTLCCGTAIRMGALNSQNRLWAYTERHKFWRHKVNEI